MQCIVNPVMEEYTVNEILRINRLVSDCEFQLALAQEEERAIEDALARLTQGCQGGGRTDLLGGLDSELLLALGDTVKHPDSAKLTRSIHDLNPITGRCEKCGMYKEDENGDPRTAWYSPCRGQVESREDTPKTLEPG